MKTKDGGPTLPSIHTQWMERKRLCITGDAEPPPLSLSLSLPLSPRSESHPLAPRGWFLHPTPFLGRSLLSPSPSLRSPRQRDQEPLEERLTPGGATRCSPGTVGRSVVGVGNSKGL